MRLSRSSRVILALFGLALIAAGIYGSKLDWSAAGVPTLIIAGMLPVIAAVIGVFPKGSVKEGTLEWPEVDRHPRIEAIEAEIAKLTDQFGRLGAAHEQVRDTLIDYLLTLEPSPNDGVTDDQRLAELREGYSDVDSELSSANYTGEPADGLSSETLTKLGEQLYRAERRMSARERFGVSGPADPHLGEPIMYTPPRSSPSPVDSLMNLEPFRQIVSPYQPPKDSK